MTEAREGLGTKENGRLGGEEEGGDGVGMRPEIRLSRWQGPCVLGGKLSCARKASERRKAWCGRRPVAEKECAFM